MEIKEYLSKIVPTVKDLLSVQGNEKESEILQIGNIIYDVESDPYDNEYNYLIIEVHTDKYVAKKTIWEYRRFRETSILCLL